jgi:glycine C-acetyltransferase
VAARTEIIDWLRQKSIPFLFSGALSPGAAGAAKAVLDLLINCEAPLGALTERRTALSDGLRRAGYRVLGGEHPLLAVDVGDAVTLQKMINALAAKRITAYGLCFPVVPEGEARVLLHASVHHSDEDIAFTLDAFETLGRQLALTSG